MFRIAPSHWMDDEGLERLLCFFEGQKASVDEIALFTHHTHAPLTQNEMQMRFERLREVMPEIRARLGVRVGINVLATMGHHEENLNNSLDAPWQRLVDDKGNVCQGSFCPNDPEYLGYVRSIYSAAAATGPDFIWVDDDVRLMGHMPIRATCFCSRCIHIFSEDQGVKFTRTLLVQWLNHGSQRAYVHRRNWLEHNRNTISRLLGAVEQAAHSVSDDLPLGFMTGDRFFEGYAFQLWAEALGGRRCSEVRWRPGGGFYWDDAPIGMVEKAHDVGRQVAALPDRIAVIQSEVENFPYHLLKKSVKSTMLEAGAHMAAGATGLAFNVLGGFPEPLGEYRPFLGAVADARGFFEEMHSLGGLPALGIWPAWNQDLYAVSGTTEDWLGRPSIHDALKRQYILAEIGLPICYSYDASRVVTFSGNTPLAFDEEDLLKILGGGVFLDVPALDALEQMSLAHLAGVHVGEAFERDVFEVITRDALNDSSAGRLRDCRQSFWHDSAFRLEPDSDAVSVLATLGDYGGRELGPCMTAYENALGGRVVVGGYYPWTLIHNEAKSTQLKRVFSWLSGDLLPVVVESFAKVVVWARGSNRAASAFFILNASLDRAETLKLRVMSENEEFKISCLGGDSQIAGLEKGPGQDGLTIVIDKVDPWSACLITPGDGQCN